MNVKLTVEVSEELRRQAKAVAASQGRTLTDVVRSALESYMEQTASSEGTLLIDDPIFQMVEKYSGSSENVPQIL